MIHLGDITQIRGDKIPVVDIITGGSPCQDLSVAGNRAGLDGERSGLFMEQIRIVKEMRERDRRTGRSAWLIRPRFMVWENVPGAFSSNKGRDFQAVLSETVKITESDAPDVPLPDRGKWSHSGCLYSDMGDWSIAWRVHDAQFWGVPQRRKRIALVADFGGLTAPEILFERKGLSRDIEPCGAARERAAAAVEGSSGGAEPILLESNQNHATIQTDGISTALPASAGFSFGNSAKARSIGYEEEVSPTLRGGEGGNQKPCVLDAREPLCIEMTLTKNTVVQDGVSPTLTARMGTGGNQVNAVYGCFQNTGRGWWNQSNVGATLRTPCGGDSVKASLVTSLNSIVRRLTPLECERLQGFPDGWTDIGEWTDSKGRLHKESDSPRYKALGNSIALPFWEYLARRICAFYERPATMGSLFDGIGGFPLVFERAGAKAVWASEIEEFPIAVTKLHFPEERSIE